MAHNRNIGSRRGEEREKNCALIVELLMTRLSTRARRCLCVEHYRWIPESSRYPRIYRWTKSHSFKLIRFSILSRLDTHSLVSSFFFFFMNSVRCCDCVSMCDALGEVGEWELSQQQQRCGEWVYKINGFLCINYILSELWFHYTLHFFFLVSATEIRARIKRKKKTREELKFVSILSKFETCFQWIWIVTLRLTKDNIVNQLNGYINERSGYNKNVFLLRSKKKMIMRRLWIGHLSRRPGNLSEQHQQKTTETAREPKMTKNWFNSQRRQRSLEMKISMCHFGWTSSKETRGETIMKLNNNIIFTKFHFININTQPLWGLDLLVFFSSVSVESVVRVLEASPRPSNSS